jgi:HEAT repeat protein
MKRQVMIATALVFACFFAAMYVAQAGNVETSEVVFGSVVQDPEPAPAGLADKIRALSSSNALERASAACQIGEMGKRAAQAIPMLIQVLGDDTQINAEIDCGERNKWRGKHSDQPTTPGEMAALALASIGEPSVEPVIAAMRNDSSIVRRNAVWSLGIIHDPRTVAAVINASRDSDPRVRENAVWGMGLKQDKSVVEPLIAALADGEWKVREKGAWSLGLQGDSRSVEPLTNALRDQNAKVREQVAWALGLKGNKDAVEPLTNALHDAEWRVREKAAWALGLKGDNRAVDPLIAALKDENVQVREQAAWALGLRGDHRSVDALSAAMKDQSKEVRKKAAWALGLILMRDPKAADKAGDLDINLKNPDRDVDNDNKSGRDDDRVGGVRVPNIDVPFNVSIPIIVDIDIPVPVAIPRINVSPRVDLTPDNAVPSKIKSKQKEKHDDALLR